MPYLNLKEVAEHLGVSQKTVYRLLSKGELPAVKVGRQWRFYRREIEAWLRKEKPETYVLEHVNSRAVDDRHNLLLSEAIEKGNIFFRVKGKLVGEVLKNAINLIPLDRKIDREKLTNAIIAREKLCTTAIGQGIALPHPRHPYHSDFAYSRISLCFLENEVDFGALDKKPVNKLFFVFGKTEREHLQLLKILAVMLQQSDFISLLENQPDRIKILEFVQQREKGFQLEAILT